MQVLNLNPVQYQNLWLFICINEHLFVLILRQNLQSFAKTFYLWLIVLVTPKRDGQVMGGFGVEIFLLTVSEGLEIVGDELELTLVVVVSLRVTAVKAIMEQ